jgi:hypothetical protein
MKIGCTATRFGCTDEQLKTLLHNLLILSCEAEAHHGDCVGGDSDFHNIIRKELPTWKIVGHPPLILSREDDRMWAKNKCDELREPKRHLARNRDIVNEVDILFAMPYSMTEQHSGGTWYTINFARKHKKPLVIIFPDGSTKSQNAIDSVVKLG